MAELVQSPENYQFLLMVVSLHQVKLAKSRFFLAVLPKLQWKRGQSLCLARVDSAILEDTTGLITGSAPWILEDTGMSELR
ncbi:hypothetical protein RRG08_020843 [Elysia crispata]|uniref:Uncharacterized protein n=1 Tax=Elysia crispata TaxID=231223 RepID=A0AAE0XUU7_9GAST|nr:hypothetical protein RRG08_020843 [Elysia crispata]